MNRRAPHVVACAIFLAFSTSAPVAAESRVPQDREVAALEAIPAPPIANGATLAALRFASPAGPGQVSMMFTTAVKLPDQADGGTFNKASPATSPASYSDLVFTAITPCRIYDSRPAYGGSGTWAAASTNTVVVGPSANYTAQGGSATDCGLPALFSAGQIAAVMASVTTVTPAANGFLSFFSFGGTNPFPYGVSQFYAAGGIGTAFVVMTTDLNGAVWTSGYTTKQVDVVIDVVGVFAKPKATTLDCVTTANTTLTVAAGGTANAAAPACAAGYTAVSTNCQSTTWTMPFVFQSGGTCSAQNNGASSANLSASRVCCRVPGR